MPHDTLQFDRITKSFPGVRALDGVSFGAQGGHIHALLGENGAGKSTLLKILSSVYQPDAGTVLLNGKPFCFSSAIHAIRAGVAVIYQELQLVPELSVAENLYLGHLPNRLGWLSARRLRDQTLAALSAMGERINPKAKISSLPIAQRQMIEVAKALSRQASVIAFDEPTSSLSSREVNKLFGIIRGLKAQGRIVFYVTHRMDEVFQLCDCATVLRDGRHVQTLISLAGVKSEILVKAMVGRPITDVFHYSPRPTGATALDVQNLQGPGLAEPVNFSLRAHEILGIFGLVGAGRSELLKLIYGATRASSGAIQVNGQAVTIRNPKDAVRNGIVLCPEDRKREGILPTRSVQENINISGRRHFAPMGFWIHRRRERQNADQFVRKLAIKTPSLSQPVVNLSGGNQQKAILARWLSERIRVILLDEPTRGIDVGAKSEIYSIIYDLARQGAGVLIVSSELPEVLGICDRILVMRQGELVADLPRDQANEERLLHLALPQSPSRELEAGCR